VITNSVPDVPQNASPPRFLLAKLLSAIGFGLVAMTICLPSMPEWSDVFQTSQANVQLSFSVYVISFGLSQVVYGPLSDRYGRRRLLILGFALAGVGSIVAALAPSLTVLTVARFVQGAGTGAGMVLGRAMVQDHFGGVDRARVMAYIGMAMGICAPLATIIGGQVHVHFGWRANFVLTAVLAMALILTTLYGLPADARPTGARAHWLREVLDAYKSLLRVPAFVAYGGILALSTGTFYVYLTGLPMVLANYGVGPGAVGFFIMVVPLAYIVGNYLTSRLVRRFSESELMLIGQCLALTGIAVTLILALYEVRSPFAVAAPLILLGIGQGLLTPSLIAGTVGVVPALAGAGAGAAGLGQQLSGAFGGYAIGLFQHDSAVALALLMMSFMLAALVGQFFLHRIHIKARSSAT